MKSRFLKFGCDAAVVLGALLFSYGLHLAWRPLGFIVGGAVLAAGAFFIGYQKTTFRSNH